MSSALIDASKYTPALLERVQRIIDKGVNGERRVWAWDEIRSILLQQKLAWYSQEHSDRVGVHTSNRSTFGVDGLKVHVHMLNIKKAGFSVQKCSDVVALEIGDSFLAAPIVEFTDQIATLSNGLLPMFPQVPKLASLGGGHTNFGLRAIVHGCQTPLKELGETRLDQGLLSNPCIENSSACFYS